VTDAQTKSRKNAESFAPGGFAILNALKDVILVIDRSEEICFANTAAEQFFGMGIATLCQRSLSNIVASDSPLLGLVGQVLAVSQSVAEYGADLGLPGAPTRPVDIQVTPVTDGNEYVLVELKERSIAKKMDRLLVHRGAARSVAGMAAVLAHEIKNPLSGIRGAAQLMEGTVTEDDKPLTRLIQDESDRICGLVDRMEVFADGRPAAADPVNIHQVLEHVRMIAENGFARHVRFIEAYDPSLPPIPGDRDQLIQVCLNLVKNAAEAVPEKGGEITLETAFRHGVRLALPGTGEKVGLPLEISIRDNGPGVPEDLRSHMFDPFVSTKERGSGLGLALVAKIVADHGGVIECDSEPRRTTFRLLMPMHRAPGIA
jgi:two-component system, NtrC family, nitrogen regulation sensor histidine kinase GlnL